LSPTINTESRETFPFVSKDNILYFASDGHPGLGGLDVFAIDLEYPTKAKVVNLGKAVNSEQDDFSFIIDPDSKKAFLLPIEMVEKGAMIFIVLSRPKN